MAKECPKFFHQVNLVVVNGQAAIHQRRIVGKEVNQLFIDQGATVTVVKIDHIPSDAFTGNQVPVAPFNRAPPSIL